MLFPAVHFFIIYSQINVKMTLFIVSDIHNHSTNCRFVLPDFATVFKILPKHVHVAVKVFYLLCSISC